MACDPSCCDTLTAICVLSEIVAGILLLYIVLKISFRLYEMHTIIKSNKVRSTDFNDLLTKMKIIEENYFWIGTNTYATHLQTNLTDQIDKKIQAYISDLKEELKKGKKNVK